MADSSFDIVSKLDRQEVDNAVNQAAREVSQRYDFRNVDASIELSGDTVVMEANSPERVIAIVDVLRSKLTRRKVSLKALDLKDREPQPSGKIYRMVVPLREGISQDNARKITKLIRDEGPKGVKAQIQGDEVRVSSKSRDSLQEVIALLRGEAGQKIDCALQFVNYR
ncbi:MAG: YajQ family cyclic di-GMP-binding protein [Actinomyces sp.]|nr:YajQ family cyclic di-GMP-binding protein [Actinomyces sp.]